MPKYKPAKAKGKGGTGERKRAAVPCIIVIVGLMVLLFVLFYAFMKGALGHAG